MAQALLMVIKWVLVKYLAFAKRGFSKVLGIYSAVLWPKVRLAFCLVIVAVFVTATIKL